MAVGWTVGFATSESACCEYCHFPSTLAEIPFQRDHVIVEKHGGKTEPDNLALSCFYPNIYNGPNIAGIDPETLEIVSHFHPRHDAWDHHFQWKGALLAGRTAVGRATIEVLCINHPDAVAVRESLLAEKVSSG